LMSLVQFAGPITFSQYEYSPSRMLMAFFMKLLHRSLIRRSTFVIDHFFIISIPVLINFDTAVCNSFLRVM
jgi:hypothetical protein